MRTTCSRLAAALLACLPALAAATPLPEGVTLIPGQFVNGRQPDGNTVIIDGPEGRIVVDAGRHADHTQRIQDRLAAAPDKPVLLFNTHWHLDHAGGLVALRKAYPQAPLYAADRGIRNVGSGFLAGYREQLVAALKSPEVVVPEDAEPRAELALIGGSVAFYPTHDLPRPRAMSLAGRKVYIGAGSGVSGGDSWLRDDASGVLVAGDLVTLPAPLFDTACMAVWAEDLNLLSAARFDTLVPGHGRPLDRDEFLVWYNAFGALQQCVEDGRSAERCRDGWLKDTRKLVTEDADRALASQLLDYYLAGPLTQDAQARLCAGR
jgi:glyoxylase-like metal-dependent hydrolase (beta-lactamase superfamily II)